MNKRTIVVFGGGGYIFNVCGGKLRKPKARSVYAAGEEDRSVILFLGIQGVLRGVSIDRYAMHNVDFLK